MIDPGRIAADPTPAAGAEASRIAVGASAAEASRIAARASAASTLVFHVERLPIGRPHPQPRVAPPTRGSAPEPRLANLAPRSAPGWRAVLAWPLLALLWIYRRLVSPALPPACRYYPSCSQYAVEAVTLHGPFRGAWIAARRLLRCHPWAPGGPDPVPPARVRPDPERVPK